MFSSGMDHFLHTSYGARVIQINSIWCLPFFSNDGNTKKYLSYNAKEQRKKKYSEDRREELRAGIIYNSETKHLLRMQEDLYSLILTKVPDTLP